MIRQLKPRTLFAVHLQSPSVSGGKDWVGSITAEDEIHSFWGKTGQVNQHAAKKGDHPQLLQLIRSKISKGYVRIDEYRDGSGWRSQAGYALAEAQEPKPRNQPEAATARPPALLRDDTQALAWDF